MYRTAHLLIVALLFTGLTLAVPAVAHAQTHAAQADAAPPEDAAPQMLNLKNAGIQAFIATVSEITGKNFILGPNVKGSVTVVSQEPLDKEQIYEVFQQVLAVHGYVTLAAGDGMVKIVSKASARGHAPLVTGQGARASAGLVTRVVAVHHVPATQLAALLQQFAPQGSKIVAHAPSNSLILSDRPAVVQRLQHIITRVDSASSAHVEVIPLQHANAAEMARMLSRLSAGASGQGANAVTVLADTRTNSILLSGSQDERLAMRTLVAALDSPMESGGATHVVYLDHASAKDLVPILSAVARDLKGQPGAGIAEGDAAAAGDSTTIQADANTNSLIITAAPAVFRSLASVIDKLDIRRAQVLIEAVIAEVGLTTAREIGVQWQLPLSTNEDGSIDNSVIGGTNFGNTNNILQLFQNPLGLGGGFNLGYINGSITLPGSDTPILQIGALVRALEADGNSNVLSTPSIVTLDNHEAEITVAKEVPFVTGSYTSAATGGGSTVGNPFQTIQRKDVGLTLTVTPHISAGDTVRMEIHQVVSSLAPSVPKAVDLVTNKREIKTSVLVADGSMLVLGGLISKNTSDSVQKVPLLGDIPIIGNLFRYRSNSNEKQNLMVFLHPTILRNPATEAAVSREKYNYMRSTQLEMRANTDLLTPPEKMPVLPPMHDFLADPATLPQPDARSD